MDISEILIHQLETLFLLTPQEREQLQGDLKPLKEQRLRH